MRITPLDIQNKQFRAARMRGYNADDVDAFLDEIAIEIDGAVKEIDGLKAQIAQASDQLSHASDQLTSHEQMKETMNAAIINAQKLADEIRGDAERRAAAILADAQKQSDRLAQDAEKSEHKLLKKVDDLRKVEEGFRTGFVAMLEGYLNAARSEGSLAPDVPAPPALEPEAQTSPFLTSQEPTPQAPSVIDAPMDMIQVEQPPAAESAITPEYSPTVDDQTSAQDIPPLDAQVSQEPAHFAPMAEAPAVSPQAVEPDQIDVIPKHLASGEALPASEEPDPSNVTYDPETPSPEAGLDLGALGLADETRIEPEPAQEAAAPTPIAPEPQDAAPEASADPPGITASGDVIEDAPIRPVAVDDIASKDEIAEAVERMRKMLGEAGIDTPAGSANGSGDDTSAQETPADTSGFSDLGEGVPGARKRKDQEQERGFGSEVD